MNNEFSTEGFTLNQSVWVKPGRKSRRRKSRRRKKAVENSPRVRMYLEVYHCDRTLPIPGLDHSFVPGEGWTETIH